MKLLLENWRKFVSEDDFSPEQEEFPERYGNCGILALAYLEEGIRREIKGMEIVFVTEEVDVEEIEEPVIHHVALFYNDKYYDDRGVITREELGQFSPLGLTSPEGAPPEEGHDYLLSSYMVETSQELNSVSDIVKNNTNWWKTCEEYKQRAETFWEDMK